MAEECDGTFGTMAEAIEELGIPRLKTVRPIASYKGKLQFGDPKKYDTAVSIDVERYPKVSVLRPPTASAYAPQTNEAEAQNSMQSSATVKIDQSSPGNELANVRNNYAYEISSESIPGGKKGVDRDDLAKGYEYGRTAVHITETDENITKMETEAGLDIIGFIYQDKVWDKSCLRSIFANTQKYQRYMALDQSHMIVAQRADQEATLALSSFIRALFTSEIYAVARLVMKDGKDPQLVLLAPLLEPDLECLIEMPIPFTEDIRSYQFPSLDKVTTVSGKQVTEHRYLPKEGLLTTMNDYVDGMDLSSKSGDDER